MQPNRNAARRACMTVKARVRRINPDRSVDLSILPPPRCSGCEGVCLWGWAPVSSLRLHDAGRHHPGDLVTVSLKSRHALQGALLLHGLPWAGLLVGAAAGVAGLGGDLGALIGALAGLAAGLTAGRSLQGHWRVAPTLIEDSDH